MIELVEHLNVLKDLETYIENNFDFILKFGNLSLGFRKKLFHSLETLNFYKKFFNNKDEFLSEDMYKIYLYKTCGCNANIVLDNFKLDYLYAMIYTINAMYDKFEIKDFELYKLLLEKLDTLIDEYIPH